MPNPTQDSPAARPRKRRWRILRRVVLGLLLLLAGLYLTRNQVLGPLAVSVAQSQFDEQFDCDLTVEEVSGNWFGNLQLSGVNLVRRSGDFPLARCQDATVALHYSLRSLLSGELAGLHSVELEAARLDIAPPASAEEQPAAVDRAPFELPVVLPAVAISVQRLNVEGEGAALIAWRDVAVQVDPAGPGEQSLELSFVSERERANLTGTYGASGLTLDGELERDEVRAEVSLSTPLDLDLVSLLSGSRAQVALSTSEVVQLLPEESRARFAQAPETQLELDLEWTGEELRASAGELVVGTSRADLRSLRLLLGPDLTAPHVGAHIALVADVASRDLAPLGPYFGTEEWAGSVSGQLTLSGPLDALRGFARLNSADTVIAGRALGETDIAVELNGEALLIERFEARGDLGTARASGGWNWKLGEFLGLELEYDLSAAESFGIGSIEAGRAHLSATLDGPTLAPRGTLQITAQELILAGSALDRFELEGSILGWGELDLDRLLLQTREGVVSAAGRWVFYEGLGTLTLTELLATRGEDELSLAAPLVARFGDWGAEVEPFELVGELGRVRGELSGTPTETRFAFACEDLDPMPLLAFALPLGVRLDGINGTLTGAVGDALECDLDITVDAWSPDPEVATWQLAARAQFAGEQLVIDHLAARQELLGHLAIAGQAGLTLKSEDPLAHGELALDVELEAHDLDGWARTFGLSAVDLAGRAKGNAELRGTWNSITGKVFLAASELLVSMPGASDTPLGPGELQIDWTLADSIELRTSHLEFPGQARLDVSGSIATGVSAASIGADVLQAASALRMDVELPDLTWAASWSDAIRRTQGRFTCGLDIGGTLAAPTLDGELVCTEAGLRLASNVPAIGAMEARAKFDHERLYALRLDAELGGAPFALTGEISFGSGQPEVALHIEGDDLLLQRGSGLKLRADTDIQVNGPVDALVASGEVSLTDGRYVRNIDLLGGVMSGGGGGPTAGRGLDLGFAREGPLAALALDIDIRTEEAFRLKNNIIQGGLRPDLHLGGTGAVPLLIGPIYLEPTRINLPSGRLHIDSGTVLFREEDPFVPAVDLSGSAHIKGYDIEVQVTGDMLEQEILVSSIPPLANDDLVVLLVTGRLPENESHQNAGQAIAVYFAQDVFARWLADEDPESKETFFDRLEIETGGDVTRSGVMTSEVSFRLSKKPRGPGRMRFLTGERDVYDKMNLGYRFLFRFK
jgi:hypothetical protein